MNKAIEGFTRKLDILARPTDTQCIFHVAILSLIILLIGIYFISTAIFVAKDGIVYIEVAPQLSGGAGEALRGTRQPPGYPFLIYGMHQLMGISYGADSLGGWIISAQVASLLSKLVACLAIYFIGSYLVGSQFSFWGVLILSLLPDAVEFGSDALSDWPSLMFLSVGFLLLLISAKHCKFWMWGLAGVMAGFGYLVRPECAQLVLYGGIWLAYNVIRPQSEKRRSQAAGSLFLLVAGFSVIALPYMLFKGYVFPEQCIWEVPKLMSSGGNGIGPIISSKICLAGVPVGTAKAFQMFISNIFETLIYFFVPPLLIGGHRYFRKYPRFSVQTFFLAAFILVNVARALWQPTYVGFISRRHTLPLVAFIIFFVPIGLQMISDFLSRQSIWPKLDSREKGRRWFLILISVGLIICGIKLVRMAPLRWEKQGYRDAAIWLNQNTEPNDIIAVPDKRIAFYAERRGMEYDSKIPKQYAYIVAVSGRKGNGPVFDGEVKEVYSTEMNRKKKDQKVVIYQALREE